MLLLAMGCVAQDQSLGDVARESRARAAQPKPAKTLNSDGPEAAVTASDDPLAVVTRSATAMLHDAPHRCETQSSGNSGPRPGWSEVAIIEIAGADRVHVIGEFTNPKRRTETIFIGGEAYQKTDNGPWEKIDAMRGAQVNGGAMTVPDELKFGYKPGDLKLMGREVIGGVFTFHYRFQVRDSFIDRTVHIWVGAGDSLPRKAEMVTHDLQSKIDSYTSTDCTYGIEIKIEAPM